MTAKRPFTVPLFRAAGTLLLIAAGVAGATAIGVFAGSSLGAPLVAGVPGGLVLLTLAVVLALWAALLFGFATNLELLHNVRENLRGRRPI